MKNQQINIPEELFTKFNNIKYYDEPHKYYLNGKELISVTTIIHQYQEPFKEDYWAEIKANQFGITTKEVKRAWKFINKKGTLKGSIIHDYAENIFQNKIFDYPKQQILNEFGFDPIWNEYLLTKKHVEKFYDDTKGKLIPIKAEFVIYDEESLIAGMLDKLFYNVKTNEFQIWDYKTNKSFSQTSERFLLDELSLINDCDLEIYSLQLQLYKYIIEKNTNIKLGKSYLVWLSHNNQNYQVIETKDRSYHVNKIVNNRIKMLQTCNN